MKSLKWFSLNNNKLVNINDNNDTINLDKKILKRH